MVEASPDFCLIRPAPGSALIIAFDLDQSLIDIVNNQGDREAGWLFLRDRMGDGFYGGTTGLGETIEAVVASLRSMIAELSPARLITIGQGIGGHAALVHGVLLGASRIIAIEPYAHLIETRLEQYHDHRWKTELSRLPDQELARQFEVTSLIERERFQGQIHVLLGTARVSNLQDAAHHHLIHAHWLERSSCVTLHPFAEFKPGLMEQCDPQDEPTNLLAPFLLDELPENGLGSKAPTTATPPVTHRLPLIYHARLTMCRIDSDNPANTSGNDLAYAAVGQVDPSMTRKMEDGLRQWIVENLLLDGSPEDLAKTLEAKGISRKETLREIEIARLHPYFFASRRLSNRIHKRDWMIATYRKLNRMRRKSTKIERREQIQVDTFLKEYYSTGRPLIMTGMINAVSPLTPWCVAELSDGSDDEAAGSPRLIKLEDLPIDTSEIFDHESEIVVRSAASLWLGSVGSKLPPLDERRNCILAQLVGRVRVRLIPWWDILLLDDAARASKQPKEALAAASHLTPLDRPELLDFTLNPGELLFVPAACQAQLECLEPAAMVSFDRFSLEMRL